MPVMMMTMMAMAITPVAVAMSERKVKSNHRAGRHVNRTRDDDRRGVNDRRRLIINGRGLNVNGLLNHDRLSLNNRLNGLHCLHRLLHDYVLHRDAMHDNRRRLMDDDRRGLNVNGRRGVNRLRCQSARQQQARSHACEYFPSGCPFPITGLAYRSRCAHQCRGGCYHQGFFHNIVLFCWLGRRWC